MIPEAPASFNTKADDCLFMQYASCPCQDPTPICLNLTGDHRLLLMCCSDRPEAFNAATEQDHSKGYVESMGSIVRYLSVG